MVIFHLQITRQILQKIFSKSKGSFQPAGKSTSKPVCFAFRDTGKCKYGEKCVFTHTKLSTAFVVATVDDLVQQEYANKVEHHALKMALYKKRAILSNSQKMKMHNKKLNSDGSSSYKRKSGPYQKANFTNDVSDENSAEKNVDDEQANVADVEEIEDKNSDPFDLSSPETTDQDF